MPISEIGDFSLRRLAALGALLVLLVVSSFVTAQSPSDRSSFENFAAKAEAARETGHADEAIRAYRSALELRPSWDEGWWYVGSILYDSDHFEEAIPALQRVVALQPKAGPAWTLLGLSEFEAGDYNGAFADLKTARQIGFSESPEMERVALYHIGLLLNLRGEFEPATELLVKAFGPSHFTEQIRVALGLALLRVPILPAQADPANDALVHAAGETAVLLASHETEAASRNFEQMLRDYPDTPYLHYQYGEMLAGLGHDSQAEVHFREEARIMPNASAAYRALAQALHAQKKLDEAGKASQRAKELEREAGEVARSQVSRYTLKRAAAVAVTSEGSARNDGAGVSSSSGSFDEAARLADSELRAGRMEQAGAAYRNALAIRSDWAEGWRQLGAIAYMQGRYAEAVSTLQQSVSFDARQPDAWTLLGLSEFEIKDYKNSFVHLERGRALGFHGNAAAVRISRYHLALLLNLNGEFDRAIDLLIPEIAPGALADEIQFAMGIALLRIPVLPELVKPDQRALVRRAGEVATLLSESRYDKAFPVIEALLREYPATPFIHYAYGDALAATSLYDQAQVQLREETRLNPDSALAYIRLSSIALMQHQSANALADSKKAVALAPESPEARYWLGRSYLEEGEIPAAIRELESARRYSPNSPKVHFNLARAYAKAERLADAERERAEFERLNALRPGQQRSYGDRGVRGTIEGVPEGPAEK